MVYAENMPYIAVHLPRILCTFYPYIDDFHIRMYAEIVYVMMKRA